MFKKMCRHLSVFERFSREKGVSSEISGMIAV
jgi:hypothetical protein